MDRLALNDARIEAMAKGLEQIADLPDPVGQVTKEWDTVKGLHIKKVRAPIGVIAIIYEARPNVTADAAGLCLKSGNAVILKGGSDAFESNLVISNVMKKGLIDAGFSGDLISFVDTKDRSAVTELLKCKKIDLVIPRGGNSLKEFVLANAVMPVIASAGGNCHTYVEKTADLKMAQKVVVNAKCSRPSVCNATEQLLVDQDIAEKFLPVICKELSDRGVLIQGDETTCSLFKGAVPATEEDYKTEHEAMMITVKCVKDVDEAIDRINKNGTGHSESIISEDKVAVEKFFKGVDAAAVYHNASTRFTDGFEFGFGAEMGISTQKLHVRGPIGLEGLTSEKLIIEGNGTVRE